MPATDRKKPKPQLKNLDDLFALDGEEAQGKLVIQEIAIGNLIPFIGHPFHLYEGERLADMVESVRANGVLMPVIARKKANDNEDVEILAGHNRVNAAKIAGMETVPAIVLDGISDDEAMVYVVETNLIQRSFADMSHSEKAAVIAMHHGKMFSQGKRNDILEQLRVLENPELVGYPAKATAETPTSLEDGVESDTGARTDEKIGAMYSLSRNTIARYLRISQLNAPLKVMLDKSKITFLVAVELSFLNKQEQEWLSGCLEDGFSVNAAKAATLREKSSEGTLGLNATKNILSGQTAATENKPRRVKVRGELYDRFFKPEQSTKEVETIVEEALKLYFNESGKSEGQ
jgi:ParB family chromosome partitioning protein